MTARVSRELVAAGVLAILSIAGLIGRHLPQHDQSALITSVLPDGTLIRSTQDERVYLLEGGMRRWIDSPEAFHMQGFNAERITNLAADEVARYAEGERIAARSDLVLPSEREVLPDLAPLAPYDLRLSTLGGRTVLRFTASLWNQGKQPLDLVLDSEAPADKDHLEDVYQRIVGVDGLDRRKLVGTLLWHEVHDHYHYSDFGNYAFQPMRMADGGLVTTIPAVTQKTTFCLRDDQAMDLTRAGAPARPFYRGCGLGNQGISIGWIDVYPSTLPDQYVDVHNTPPGVYALSFYLDPNQRFVEERRDNNIATTLVELNVQRGTMRVVARAAPFLTNRNLLPDGLLVRAGADERVYLLSAGKKEWIPSAEVFTARGYAWNSVYVLAPSIVDAIPSAEPVNAPSATGI